jgi:hypothetical protein
MTTDLSILGKRYDLEATFQHAELNVLVYMTKRVGVTMRSIIGGLQQIDVKMREAEQQRLTGDLSAPTDELVLLDFLSDEDSLNAFRGLVWLARTTAGERGENNTFLDLDEANKGVGIGDIGFVNGEAPAGPKDPALPASRSSSTTSKRTSGGGSSRSRTSGQATRS